MIIEFPTYKGSREVEFKHKEKDLNIIMQFLR